MQNSTAVRFSDDFSHLLTKVREINLEPIAYKLVHPEDEEGWSIEKTDALIEQYRAFLVISELYPDESIVPSKDIDKVWHTHILDTAKYREDCLRAFSKFIDHFPYFGIRGEEDAKNLQKAFDRSRDLYLEYFGFDVRSSIKSSADCGTGTCSPECSSKCGCNAKTVGTDTKSRPVLDRSRLI